MTHTVTAAPTPSAEAPAITYFGIARADDVALTPVAVDDAGRPIFDRVQGQGMAVVLEAQRGRRPIILSAYDPGGGQRGVDFLVSRPLGDGSPALCDVSPPRIGGVPGIDPPVFSEDEDVLRAIDDFGCRVNDGTGAPAGRLAEACTRSEPSFDYAFVDAATDVQFCVPIASAWSLPVGDTIIAARVRDITGLLSPTREIVVRVRQEQPFQCDQGLGERTVVVGRPGSRLVSSAAPGADASVDPWSAASLRICAGAEIADGVHPINLRADATLGVSLAGGGTLCARITARGSSGSLDCDGGSAADALATQDADGSTRVAVRDGLGLDAGTGAAVIHAPIAVAELPAGSSPEDCGAAIYPPPFNGVLTTATGTAQVLARDATSIAAASATGLNFDCAAWRDDAGGTFVVPFPLVNSSAGDVAGVLVLSEAPTP